MTHPLQRDVDGEKRERERKRFLHRRHGDDIRAMLRTEQGRRVLMAFFDGTGFEANPFHTNAMTQSFMIGMQQAHRWWLDQIREHCPEVERKMRVEAEKDAKLNNEAQNEPDDDSN